ncbi:MAG: hypothetical protein KF724_07955 [Phycisphaeraceae bacterium]|nr:hypothetical protein [Phycisphaeraceae bacterium]
MNSLLIVISVTLAASLSRFDQEAGGPIPPDTEGAAQEKSPAEAKPDPIIADDAGILRGPSVGAHQPPTAAPRPMGRASLVNRTFEGRIVPVEGEPEAAALRALDLSESARQAVDSIVTRRIEAFDELVRTNFIEIERGAAALARLEHVTSGTERWAALMEFSEAWKVFEPWRDRGSVIDEVGDAVPRAQRLQAQRMVRAYRMALLRERAEDLGIERTSAQVQAHVRLEQFAVLLQESFERQQRQGSEALEQVARELQLTPEQAEQARTIFGALAERELRREATGWDRFRALASFMETLEPAQRVRAWRYLRRADDSGMEPMTAP